MASIPSPRSPAPFSDGGSQGTLRSKRSSIMIKCSDGSEVIFLRPHRPRSGSYTAISTSHSPPPPDSGSGPSPGPSPGDSDGSQSHKSLPIYLPGRCSECGYLRGHSDICFIGNWLFTSSLTSRPSAPVPVQADEEIHNNGIGTRRTQHRHDSIRRGGIVADVYHSRSTTGSISRSPSSRPSETGRRGVPRSGRSADPRFPTHSQCARSQTNHTPSSRQGIQHSPGPRDSDHNSTSSSKARYSIEAVVGRRSPSTSTRHDKIRLELRELSSPHQGPFPLHYFDANIRGGGYGSENDRAEGSSGNRDRPSRSGGGTGRSRSRSRDVLLRCLRRAFLWLFGEEDSESSRGEAYYDYARHENRAQSRSRSRQTRRR
ncbi:hypothetical protein F4680DRAFT_391510 [Xylaria scruposa]|nr:hypothetical protein F4680DRAFT_391510 [Xylaria scruposa]